MFVRPSASLDLCSLQPLNRSGLYSEWFSQIWGSHSFNLIPKYPPFVPGYKQHWFYCSAAPGFDFCLRLSTFAYEVLFCVFVRKNAWCTSAGWYAPSFIFLSDGAFRGYNKWVVGRKRGSWRVYCSRYRFIECSFPHSSHVVALGTDICQSKSTRKFHSTRSLQSVWFIPTMH